MIKLKGVGYKKLEYVRLRLSTTYHGDEITGSGFQGFMVSGVVESGTSETFTTSKLKAKSHHEIIWVKS